MLAIKELDPIAVGIKKKIIEKGLLQKAVAERAGFTEQQFSDMLNDRRIIRACDLFRISTVSAPVIKCKKTPRKKCSFVAEVKEKR